MKDNITLKKRTSAAQKVKFSIKNFFSKYDQSTGGFGHIY